jgi:hypothetical protein
MAGDARIFVCLQRHKERRARFMAARDAASPLNNKERRTIDAINGCLNCDSSLWPAVSKASG